MQLPIWPRRRRCRDDEFNDDDAVSTLTTARIMLTFCMQYKSLKTTYNLYMDQWFRTTYGLDF